MSKPAEKGQAHVIVVCQDVNKAKAHEVLCRLTSESWEDEKIIQMVVIPQKRSTHASFVTQTIEANLPTHFPHILVPNDIKIVPARITERGFLNRPANITNLLRAALPHTLKQLRLDWSSKIEDTLRNAWRHGEVDRNALDAWIEQFDKLDGAAWIAEELLRRLDFWSEARVRKALRINKKGLAGIDCICVNQHAEAGKSAGVIANLVKKQLAAPELNQLNMPLLDIREALIEGYKNVLYVEDCLITGNEMSRVLGGLTGVTDPAKAKAVKLPDAAMLTSAEIQLRVALTTNYALTFLERYLGENHMNNITIDIRTTDNLPILTPVGIQALKSDALCDEQDCLVHPDQYISPVAFTGWTNEDKRQRAINFCSEVGYQLYQSYLQSHNKEKPDAWIRQCALGVRQAALTTAFSHSIPKETLPLFWANGTIKWGRKNVLWTPLFQAAE